MSPAGQPPSSAAHRKHTLQLQQAFKLAVSMSLFYWLALAMDWDEPQYGGLAILIISLGTSGATIEKGVMRFVGTTVGVAVGFLILGLFNHDRWATMLAFAGFLTVIGYFMQSSRYSYAWYVAAFVPLVVWGDNYPHFENAFMFGTFRWLETAVGILIYTAVDIVLWPRSAGKQLNQQGHDLWVTVLALLDHYRQDCERGQRQPAASALWAKVPSTFSATLSSLQDAYADTPDVRSRKSTWETWRLNTRAFVDALGRWRESFDTCRALDLDELLPALQPVMDTLHKRLTRIDELWEARQTADRAAAADDHLLLETMPLDSAGPAAAGLSAIDRAAVLNFVSQWKLVEQTSRDLLGTMQSLCDIGPRTDSSPPTAPQASYRSSRWDPDRLIHALFPTTAFIAAFLFWILVNPPTGPKIPMFAGILGLVLLRTPMNPLTVLLLFVMSIFVVVAPIYWLVMPSLGTGYGLIGLVFVLSFVFGYLGGRSPALKSGPLIMFVTMTGISNQQSYSFQGTVDGALMIVLSGAIVTMVYFLFRPKRPEQALLSGLRRYFDGCARVTRGMALDSHAAGAQARQRRRQSMQSIVLPACEAIQQAIQQLDYRLYPDNDSEKLQRLHDGLQSIAYRLESLDLAYRRTASDASEYPVSLVRLGNDIREIAQLVFERWASLRPGDAFAQHRSSIDRATLALQQELDQWNAGRDVASTSNEPLILLDTLMGGMRGLIEAMAHTQKAINEIHWPQLAAPRF